MRKFVNGWTKDSVRAQVKKFNNGSKALDKANSELCRYENSEGNRCFIGAFLPNDHAGLDSLDSVLELGTKFPDIAKYLPFNKVNDIIDFQQSHDRSAWDGADTYHALEEFLKGCE